MGGSPEVQMLFRFVNQYEKLWQVISKLVCAFWTCYSVIWVMPAGWLCGGMVSGNQSWILSFHSYQSGRSLHWVPLVALFTVPGPKIFFLPQKCVIFQVLLDQVPFSHLDKCLLGTCACDWIGSWSSTIPDCIEASMLFIRRFSLPIHHGTISL